ncbi:TetR/AcrR family transcriptional regulator C-terminal domain-containing protein [Stenotrophomonas sp. 169]|uniref:TetR/AcrR family transcriptional regulator C-terminal domain-containing protein n=1 Tax=unclassified Stenotrophomonas TaxID=196198 RepID=UPI0016624D8F|nr:MULTISPECIES: TetR/AcrR family transcriptional regulator C-terminal domain-containing protein [unclassified Stenotrophomonas]MBD8636872.1 TetR/AcrR family transcriptional regulator C-terminal domain-containing protein [Stenotrophomonas sp. CFBP 13725]MBD8696218.1 TetR/AcrR family transcriptional regulator C-terminal domain-containing protein [Stenotrophomonas sp. CFBP 13718]QNR98493.1 TetR/AcrR family transcriptional regulator C-terminal domain-containing protein [Stenotrophomonas sp. 169]
MRQAIAREHIVEAAFLILDEAGLEGLTLRKVACSLGIRAPSLYWHFKSKQALIDAMADAMIADVARVIPDGQPWRQTLLQIAREFRLAFKARRDGARVYVGTFLATENMLRVAEASIAALVGAGAPVPFAATTGMDLVYYTMGFVIEEQSWPGDGSMEALGATFMALAEARFPRCWQARDIWREVDFDARFEQGLGLMLDGIELRLARAS